MWHFDERLKIGIGTGLAATSNAPTTWTSVAWNGTMYYTLTWDNFEDEDGQKSCFPSTCYYLSTVLTSHFRLNSPPTGHLFNPFQLNRRCNYQKSMGPGPLTNRGILQFCCTIYCPWFSLCITVTYLSYVALSSIFQYSDFILNRDIEAKSIFE